MDSNPVESPHTDALHQEEHRHLVEVLSKVDRQLQHLKSIPRKFDSDNDEAQTADEIAEQTVERMRDEQMTLLQSALSEPYFGRFDFQESTEPEPQALYIGKRGVEDGHTGDRLVIDWRAPIASMFYSFTGQGDTASYQAPDGDIEGNVYLKRNILVRNGQLQRVVDSYVHGQDNLNVTDEFLLYRLTENKDSRLRDIVSTIQAEQDRIIRADRTQAIVIQGVAGSGKTTVALHRLAYLLYQHSDRMLAERMVIFAPNAMFVDYISEVLPELGVGGIQQTTFATWALQVLENAVVLSEQGERLTRWFGINQDERAEHEFRVSQYKGSTKFQRHLDSRLRRLEESLVPNIDFTAWEGKVLDVDTIRRWFTAEYAHYPLAQRKDRVLARVKRWYEIELKNLRGGDSKTLKKQSAQRFRAYQSKWAPLSAIDIYRQTLAEGLPGIGTAELKESKVPAKGKGKRLAVDVEDLAAIIYLHFALNGVDSRDRFHHVVIDEAQDFSPLQVLVLKACCPSESFTILGDLSQSIHTYQGITNWQSFLDLFEEEKAQYFQLDVSYRSTMEIIEFANDVIGSFEGFTLAKPVFRSGEPVTVSNVTAMDRFAEAVRAVRKLAVDHNTIAVVCRTDDTSRLFHKALVAAGVDAHLIDSRQQQYAGGISVLPVYLTKGLEFDAVLMVDVTQENYAATALSAKLLYVGCTRALHKLWVQYTGDASPLITGQTGVTSATA